MKNNVELSAIITVHNEGILVHKTMRSVFLALEKVKEAGRSFEVIVHIDNGDEATKKYFDRYKNDENVRIFENSFGDTGPSRNFAVSKARGKYVAFLDGDDLISDNWYILAMEILDNATEEVVVHPEAILTFGVEQENVLTIQKETEDFKKDILILIGENRWGSGLMAKRETLLKMPYRKVGGGYGHEDYIFNIEAVTRGVFHKIAKGTVYFYRRSETSRLSAGQRGHVIIPYVEAFDFEKVRDIDDEGKVDKKIEFKNQAYKVYKKIRNNDRLNYFITPVAKVALKVVNRGRVGGKVPSFVVDEWKKMNQIDSQLWPYKQLLNEVHKYQAEEYIEVGRAYCRMARSLGAEYDYAIITPWLVRGGADKVVLNYVEALKEINPDWKIVVITTLPVRNTWRDKLPKDVDFVDFGNEAQGLAPNAQDILFSRIITQLRTPRLHIVNSEFGYNWVRSHKELIRNHYKLYVSLFCDEFIPGSKMKGVFTYSNPYLLEIIDEVKKVFTDNETIIKKTVEKNAFDEMKFKVHYQPVKDVKIEKMKRERKRGPYRLLWASRIVPAKMPEMVLKIGTKLEVGKVEIDMFGEMKDGVDLNFETVQTVKYKGEFDGFSSLKIEDYDALLYTALDDGVPNVILEATAAGLPVIASNDGGVGEFIRNNKTGLLVEDYLNPEAYVRAIEFAIGNPENLREYNEDAQKLLQKHHSWESFVESVKKDIS